MDLDSLKAFLGSDVKSKKIDPVIKELEALSKTKKVHQQNFVADDF